MIFGPHAGVTVAAYVRTAARADGGVLFVGERRALLIVGQTVNERESESRVLAIIGGHPDLLDDREKPGRHAPPELIGNRRAVDCHDRA
jgi:hypothetical protein